MSFHSRNSVHKLNPETKKGRSRKSDIQAENQKQIKTNTIFLYQKG